MLNSRLRRGREELERACDWQKTTPASAGGVASLHDVGVERTEPVACARRGATRTRCGRPTALGGDTGLAEG